MGSNRLQLLTPTRRKLIASMLTKRDKLRMTGLSAIARVSPKQSLRNKKATFCNYLNADAQMNEDKAAIAHTFHLI